MDVNREIIQSIFSYFINDMWKLQRSTIIKKHCDKLGDQGDYSFPIDLKNWKQFLNENAKCNRNKNIFTYRLYSLHHYDEDDDSDVTDVECDDGQEKNSIAVDSAIIQQEILNLIETSQTMRYSFAKAMIQKNRCVIFMNRTNIFTNVIPIILSDKNFGKLPKDEFATIEFVIDEEATALEEAKTITEYRCDLVRNAIRNLIEYSKFVIKPNSNRLILNVTNKSSNCLMTAENVKTIICGVVQDPRNGHKLANISALEYIKKRSVDIQLMAQHKYGLRVKNEQFFVDLIHMLGVAAVTVDLLEVKHSSPVALHLAQCTSGTSKGAAFILYNSARLETLFDTFNGKVESGYYPPLPPIESIDFTLLKEEEEWQLMFNYVIDFPNMIARSIDELGSGNHLGIHFICSYLSGLTAIFSVYYRRVRILTENRPQLLPYLQTRLYLLKCVQIVMKKSLQLLDIEPIHQM